MASSKRKRNILGWVMRNKIVSGIAGILLVALGQPHLAPVLGGAAQQAADERIAEHCTKHGAGPDCES